MGFDIVFLSDAEKQLRALDGAIARRILAKLAWIARQKDPIAYAKLLRNPKIGDLRFRVGDYRAIAVIDTKKDKIVIFAVGHRRLIYR